MPSLNRSLANAKPSRHRCQHGEVSDPSTFGPDRSWFLDINEWAKNTPWLHGAMKLYAGYGAVLFAVLILVGYVLARRQRSAELLAASLWAGLAPLLAVAANQPLARGVDEPRPFTSLQHVLVLAHRSTDPSFASDHGTMAGAVAVGLLLVSVRLGLVAVAAALLMAFARVYVGAHYPIDVVAGLTLGAGTALIGWLLLRRPLTWLIERAAATPLRFAVPVA